MRFGVAPTEFNAVAAIPAVLEIASKRCSDRMEARFRSAANTPARANISLSVGASTRVAGVGPSRPKAGDLILATGVGGWKARGGRMFLALRTSPATKPGKA